MVDGILYEKDGAIATITLNRPDRMNAIPLSAFVTGLAQIWRDFEEDRSLRVAILTAEGQKIFSAGWDLKALNSGDIKLDNWWEDCDYGDGGFAGLTETQAEAACKSLKRSGMSCFTAKN